MTHIKSTILSLITIGSTSLLFSVIDSLGVDFEVTYWTTKLYLFVVMYCIFG